MEDSGAGVGRGRSADKTNSQMGFFSLLVFALIFFYFYFLFIFFAPGKVRTWGGQKVTKQISSSKSVSISNFTGSSKALGYTLTVTRQPLLAALSEVAKTTFRARLKALSLIQAYVTREPFGSVPETSAGHRQ